VIAAKPTASAYVHAVLSLYVQLPGTRSTPSRQDHRLAAALYERGIPLAVVRAALMLAAARRTLRSPQAAALPPIGCLHYFLPVIGEVQQLPPDPAYIDYLAAKLQPLMKQLCPATATPAASTPGQKTSLPGGR
jgi:hypothetical protein